MLEQQKEKLMKKFIKNKIVKIAFKFIWYDFWVGFFYDKNKKYLYINLLPTLVIIIGFRKAKCVKCGKNIYHGEWEIDDKDGKPNCWDCS